jgi:hypothetical protein
MQQQRAEGSVTAPIKNALTRESAELVCSAIGSCQSATLRLRSIANSDAMQDIALHRDSTLRDLLDQCVTLSAHSIRNALNLLALVLTRADFSPDIISTLERQFQRIVTPAVDNSASFTLARANRLPLEDGVRLLATDVMADSCRLSRALDDLSSYSGSTQCLD